MAESVTPVGKILGLIDGQVVFVRSLVIPEEEWKRPYIDACTFAVVDQDYLDCRRQPECGEHQWECEVKQGLTSLSLQDWWDEMLASCDGFDPDDDATGRAEIEAAYNKLTKKQKASLELVIGRMDPGQDDYDRLEHGTFLTFSLQDTSIAADILLDRTSYGLLLNDGLFRKLKKWYDEHYPKAIRRLDNGPSCSDMKDGTAAIIRADPRELVIRYDVTYVKWEFTLNCFCTAKGDDVEVCLFLNDDNKWDRMELTRQKVRGLQNGIGLMLLLREAWSSALVSLYGNAVDEYVAMNGDKPFRDAKYEVMRLFRQMVRVHARALQPDQMAIVEDTVTGKMLPYWRYQKHVMWEFGVKLDDMRLFPYQLEGQDVAVKASIVGMKLAVDIDKDKLYCAMKDPTQLPAIYSGVEVEARYAAFMKSQEG